MAETLGLVSVARVMTGRCFEFSLTASVPYALECPYYSTSYLGLILPDLSQCQESPVFLTTASLLAKTLSILLNGKFNFLNPNQRHLLKIRR